MFLLDYTYISINCPQCKYCFEAPLIDIRLERSLICHNCKVTIRLQDDSGSTHNGLRDISKVMNDLKQIFKKL
jgi:uncharacterized paraquat-inducible protein A